MSLILIFCHGIMYLKCYITRYLMVVLCSICRLCDFCDFGCFDYADKILNDQKKNTESISMIERGVD